MRNIAAIFWKEMRSYFGSPIAYVVATGFLVMMGYLFQNEIVEFRAKCLNYTFQHQEHGVDPPNVNEDVVFHFFLSQCLVWLVVTPMLTMRLFAEEKGSGTIELLMTSPLTTWQVVLGKFAACLGLYVIIELLLLSLIIVVSFYGDLNWARVLSACAAILLLGGSFISVGILASSLTDKQIVAVVIALRPPPSALRCTVFPRTHRARVGNRSLLSFADRSHEGYGPGPGRQQRRDLLSDVHVLLSVPDARRA